MPVSDSIDGGDDQYFNSEAVEQYSGLTSENQKQGHQHCQIDIEKYLQEVEPANILRIAAGYIEAAVDCIEGNDYCAEIPPDDKSRTPCPPRLEVDEQKNGSRLNEPVIGEGLCI